MAYNVKLETFEGPLDLLLFLVRKNEIDIQQIPVITIAEQYMEYIELMKALNIDVAGEFLVMASTLLYLKSRALLPQPDESEDGAEDQKTLDELKKQLLEYQQYKDVAERLKEQNILEKDVFVRSSFADPVSADDTETMERATVFDLLSAFKKLMERTDGSGDSMEVSVEHLSVKDALGEILEKIQSAPDGMPFENIFSGNRDRLYIITTFLALLELIKMQAVRVYQSANFGNIYIYPVSDDEQQEMPVH